PTYSVLFLKPESNQVSGKISEGTTGDKTGWTKPRRRASVATMVWNCRYKGDRSTYLAIRDRSLDFALRSCDIYIDKSGSKYSIFAWAPDHSMTLQMEIQ